MGDINRQHHNNGAPVGIFEITLYKGTYENPCGSCGIGSTYHFIMDQMLGKGKHAIFRIPCAFLPCKNILDNRWGPSNTDLEQTIYSRVDNCVYASIIGSFNDWKIVMFKNSSTTEEEFKDIHKVILDKKFHLTCDLLLLMKF